MAIGPAVAESVGDEAGDEAADDVAHVAPEAIDADRRRACNRGDGVGDGGDQRRVDERGPDAQRRPRPRRPAATPPSEAARTASAAAWTSIPATISGFRPTRSDQWPVPDLADAPHGGVEASDQPDLSGARAVRGEEQRDDAPGQRIVEVVDEPGLRAGAQRRLPLGGVGEGLAHPRRGRIRVGVVLALLQRRRARPCLGRTARRGRAGDGDRGAGHDEHVASGELGREQPAEPRPRSRRRRSRRPR